MAKVFDLASSVYKEIQDTPGSAITGGDFLAVNDLNTFALVDVASGSLGCFIYQADKVKVEVAAVTIASGEKAYWDSGAAKVTNVSTSNTLIGHFLEDAASSATHSYIEFDGTIEGQET